MLAAFALAGCLQDIPPGPDLGRCALPPEGVYDYGTIGIGTCLAGPADLRFFEQDGGTFLAVSNADPFRNFTSGSLLVVDWNDVVSRLDAPDPPDRLYMDELVTYALPIFDDDDNDGEGENAYLGNFGYLPDSRTAIIPGRMTESAALRSGIDEAWFVDMDGMQAASGITLIGSLELQDDPYLVDVDQDANRIYVGNLTDHSISVLTTDVPVDSQFPAEKIDVAPEATIAEGAFTDTDASDSFAEIIEAGIADVTEVVEDDWTLTYVDATTRLYVPTAAEVPDVTGVVRWTSGGGPFLESPFGIEDGLGDLNDPSYTVTNDGIPYLYFARDNGDIVRAVGDFVVGSWEIAEGPLLTGGLDPIRGAPSVAPLPAAVGLWYDRRSAAGEDAWIELSASSDNLVFQEIAPVIGPTPGVSYEDPQVSLDPRAGRYRMWMSVREGTSWSIGFSESDDGVVWATPEIVLSLGSDPVAAPVVGLYDGRYEMYVDVSDGTLWDIARSTSLDGITWSVPEVVIDTDQPITGDPPRCALHLDTVGAWRLSGVDQGPNGSLLPAGLGGAAEVVDDDDPLLIRRMGFVLAVSHGHEVSNEIVPAGGAHLALTPVSVGSFGGETLLYASVEGSSGGAGIALLSEHPESFGTGDARWALDLGPLAFESQLNVEAGREVFAPVVASDDQGSVMFYAASGPDGVRIRRAESTDGKNWVPIPGTDLLGLDPADDSGWDAVAQAPHAIEFTADGVRLWYTGDDGGVFRIGSATATSLRDAFVREHGGLDPWRLAAGPPGGFDDSGVKDPVVVDIDGVPHLYYAGFDGSNWRIGHGTIDVDGLVTVRLDLSRDVPAPAMSGAERTFSAFGVESPAVYSAEPDRITLLYGGSDGLALRLGRAVIDPSRPDEVFADPRRPTPDDTMTFVSQRGGSGAQVIELEQLTGTFGTSGEGMTAIVRDPGLGFLYVTSKKDDIVYVVDIRDDTTGTFVDGNSLDLEDILRVDTGSALAGFRDAVLAPEEHLLYLSMRQPDGIVIIDTSRLVDDATTEALEEVAVATLPLPDFAEDAGVDTLATFGGAGMALTDHLLLTTHFRGNGVSVLDRNLGAWGEEIAWIQDIGENPHVVRVSPDGRWAVVANYLGDVEGDFVSSTLAIIDLDPASDRYLEAVAWMANQ